MGIHEIIKLVVAIILTHAKPEWFCRTIPTTGEATEICDICIPDDVYI